MQVMMTLIFKYALLYRDIRMFFLQRLPLYYGWTVGLQLEIVFLCLIKRRSIPNRKMFQIKLVDMKKDSILCHVQHFRTTSSYFRESVKSELNLYETVIIH
jgi:hypothetical protein